MACVSGYSRLGYYVPALVVLCDDASPGLFGTPLVLRRSLGYFVLLSFVLLFPFCPVRVRLLCCLIGRVHNKGHNAAVVHWAELAECSWYDNAWV